jgi:hypothetical protein
MANFLLLYHGGGMPETPAEQKRVMDAWMVWFGQLGAALKDGGNPVSQTRTIGPDGAAGAASADPPSGYSVIAADSLDVAVELAKGCPVLMGGASIEVCETFAVM